LAKAVVIYGKPYQLPSNLDEERLEEERRRVESMLREIDRLSDNYFRR